MLHIDEPTFNFLLAAKSVTHFDLREGDRGYEIYFGIEGGRSGALGAVDPALLKTVAPGVASTLAELKAGSNEAMLVSQRRRPRCWRSLDRFVRNIRERVPPSQPVPELRVQFSTKRGQTTRKR